MPSAAVVAAVKARLGATWNGLPVTLPDDSNGETPSDGTPFIAVQFPVANAERLTIDKRLYREVGGFRLVLNGERGAGGLDRVLTWADQLAALFRDQRFDGVSCQVPSPPILDDRNENGNYFTVAIAIPYTFTFI